MKKKLLLFFLISLTSISFAEFYLNYDLGLNIPAVSTAIEIDILGSTMKIDSYQTFKPAISYGTFAIGYFPLQI